MATEQFLSYKLKLFPSRVKADMLAALAGLFRRLHSVATQQIAAEDRSRLPYCQGRGRFVGDAYRRAGKDWRRSQNATTARRRRVDHDLTVALRNLPYSRSKKRQKRLLKIIDKTTHTLTRMRTKESLTGYPFRLPCLKAELIDSAQVQPPRQATHFDCWIKVQGVMPTRGRQLGFYIPAKYHHAINRSLALPGATLSRSAEVFRKNGKWYARVSVAVPLPAVTKPHGWLGIDVGLRASVTRSDGYQGPDLRPVCRRHRKRQHFQAKQGLNRSYDMSPQRQILSKEARRAVSVALRSGRGVSLEDPTRLPAYKQWAARHFARRVLLLALLVGIQVRLLPPAYSSQTCSRCGARDTFRKRDCFRCYSCGLTINADANSSRNLASGTYCDTAVSQGSRSPLVDT